MALHQLGLAAQRDGEPAEALRLLGAADGLRTRHRLPDPPESETRRGATLAAARDGLGADAFAAAWEAGRTAPLDLVVDQALDTVPG